MCTILLMIIIFNYINKSSSKVLNTNALTRINIMANLCHCLGKDFQNNLVGAL